MTPISSYAGGSQTFQPRMDIPLGGMKKAASTANKAASDIAGGNLEAQSFVELLGATTMFEANAKVLKVMDESIGTLLDTVA